MWTSQKEQNMLPLSGWPHVTTDTRIGTQQKNRNSPQWIAHWWADQGHWWYVVEKSSPGKSRPRHDVACTWPVVIPKLTSRRSASLRLWGIWRIHAGRAVCNQRMFLDKDKGPCLISPLIFKRTACNFRLSFSVACMRRFSFLLVLENLAAAVSHGDKASMLCNLNTHTPWMSALLGPALRKGFFSRGAGPMLQFEGFAIHLAHATTRWRVLLTRPFVSCGRAFLCRCSYPMPPVAGLVCRHGDRQ